jgi:hypothetical protein
MASFYRKVDEEFRRGSEAIGGKLFREKERVRNDIADMIGVGTRGSRGDEVRQEEFDRAEIRRIGPAPSAEMTGGLSDQRNRDRERRRRRLSLMTGGGGSGSANTFRPRLGA